MSDVAAPRFVGYVLGTTDPDRLADWYQKAFKGDTGEILGRPMVVVGGVRVVFDVRDDVSARSVEQGRFIINLFVDDIRATAAHIDTVGTTWVRELEVVENFGGVGTCEDPEGNYINLLAPVVPEG
jgi:predicted enzyme related to lactoylglutathione lyase